MGAQAAEARALQALRQDRVLAAVLVALTAVTGLVDAVSYLALGHVFTAVMTGNIVLLGFALAGTGDVSLLASLIALAGFLIGAAVGGAVGRAHAWRGWRWVAGMLTVEAALAAIATAVALLAPSGGERAIVAVLAVAMGLRNATVRRIAVPDLTTTVLTLTLTALAVETVPGGGGQAARRRVMSVVAMVAGACGGALLLRRGLAAPLAVIVALLCVMTVGYVATAVRWGAGAIADETAEHTDA